MQLVLGTAGIAASEIELLGIIIRLSSSLTASWTVSETEDCDVLLVEGGPGGSASDSIPLVVSIMARAEAKEMPDQSQILARPIFAEELVRLLNDLEPKVLAARPTATPASPPVWKRARLKRWPSQQSLMKRPGYVRLATALSKSPQSAQTLSIVTGAAVEECVHFMTLMEEDGVLIWSETAEDPSLIPAAAVQKSEQPSSAKQGLFSRIRRRLGLA